MNRDDIMRMLGEPGDGREMSAECDCGHDISDHLMHKRGWCAANRCACQRYKVTIDA